MNVKQQLEQFDARLLTKDKYHSYKPEMLQRDFENTEKWIAWQGFNIINMFRDRREDWGDDGGYQICLSEKNSKIYLHIIRVNYNITVGSMILDELDEDYEKVTNSKDLWEWADFKIFESIEQANEFIVQFIKDLDYCVSIYDEKRLIGDEEYRFYGETPECFEELNDLEGHGWDKQYRSFLYTCFFAYSEYQKYDRPRFLSLCTEKHRDYYTAFAELWRARLQSYEAGRKGLLAKINNPEKFSFSTQEIKIIERGLQRLGKFYDNYITVELDEYQMEDLAEGEIACILLQSRINNGIIGKRATGHSFKEMVDVEDYEFVRPIEISWIDGLDKDDKPIWKSKAVNVKVQAFALTIAECLDFLIVDNFKLIREGR